MSKKWCTACICFRKFKVEADIREGRTFSHPKPWRDYQEMAELIWSERAIADIEKVDNGEQEGQIDLTGKCGMQKQNRAI